MWQKAITSPDPQPAMDLMIETDVGCPHCGESFPLLVDTSVAEQDLVEDCSVCCRPINLTIVCRPGEILATREGE